MNAGSALHRLAELLGIATEFWDWKHRHTQVPDETTGFTDRILNAAWGGAQLNLREAADLLAAERLESDQVLAEEGAAHGVLPRTRSTA